MRILNSYFQKIYVLALREDQERQNLIKHTLRGVDFEFVWGISMKTLFPNFSSISELPDDFLKVHGVNKQEVSHWTIGALGCAIGHRNILRKIVEDKIQTALILEDDVYENLHKKYSIESYLLKIPKDWELIYFGFIYPTKLMQKKYLPLFVKRVYSLITNMKVFNYSAFNRLYNFFPVNVNKYFQKSGIYIGAHAYALTEKSAEKLLVENTPLRERSDIHLMNFVYHKKLKVYNTSEPLFIQNKNLCSYTE